MEIEELEGQRETAVPAPATYFQENDKDGSLSSPFPDSSSAGLNAPHSTVAEAALPTHHENGLVDQTNYLPDR